MEQALARFEQYLDRRYSQSSTPKHYLSDLRIFFRTIGDRAVKDITPLDIDAFIDDQFSRGLSPVTINRRLACIHSFFEYLPAERLERHWPNPVIKRRHILKTGSRLPRDASDKDVSKIFAVISDERDRAMFGLMVGTNLRVGEVSALQLDDIEKPSSTDSLAKLRVRGKGAKERVIWLTPSLWHTIHYYLRRRPELPDEERVFVLHQRSPTPRTIQLRLRKY